MRTLIPKKASTLFALLAFSTLFIFFISCKKNIDQNNTNIPQPVPDHTPNLTTKVSSSVSGFVTNENNEPVVAATVQVGTTTTRTNHFGYFEVKNVQVVKEAATVTVTYTGYFKGIKTYMAVEGKSAFFRIKLLPKTIAGTIDATAGGNVSLTNGLNIAFPASGIKDAASGATYTGNVNVAVQYIDPTSTELIKIMPGDLRGINSGGYIKGLTSYGMMAAELTGDAGQLLQIADGKKATITSPVPASLSATAPATIPLWYFDESNGLWKEEGTATKTGSNYVGDVSHFSFWNCDFPSSYVDFDCSIIIQDPASRIPLANAYVTITNTSSNNMSGGGFTDYSGYVGGRVPDNAPLIIKVYVNNACTIPIYTQNFSTGSTGLSLGDIAVSPNPIAHITGSVTDCNNLPLNNGFVMFYSDYSYYNLPINIGGTYGIYLPTCQGSSDTVIITAIDSAAMWQSADITKVITPGENPIPDIQACSVAFTNVISNGYFYHPASPRVLNRQKTLSPYGSNAVRTEFGDLGSLGYFMVLTVDPANHITITAAPGAGGGPYEQWDAGLPTANPGYTPQWPGSPQCNNTYDLATRTYYLRYGYTGGTGFRVVEEIIQTL